MTTLYKFKAYFTVEGVGTAPSSAPVATVLDTDANTKLADAQATTARSNLPGYYEYEYSGADDLDLVCLFHTSDTTTDQQDLVSYVVDKVYQADAKLDVIDGVVDAILVDTGTDIPASIATAQADLDNPDQYKADVSALALEATLTAIKGAGWTDETLKAISEAIAALTDVSAAEVWAYATRTLTQTATSITAAVSGSSITDIRGNTWDIDVASLTLDSNQIQFAIKRNSLDTDNEALLLVAKTGGLLRLNGAAVVAGDATKASLTYAGTTLTIAADASITAQLPVGSWRYGIQSVTSATPGVVSEPYGGAFVISSDIVRATA